VSRPSPSIDVVDRDCSNECDDCRDELRFGETATMGVESHGSIGASDDDSLIRLSHFVRSPAFRRKFVLPSGTNSSHFLSEVGTTNQFETGELMARTVNMSGGRMEQCDREDRTSNMYLPQLFSHRMFSRRFTAESAFGASRSRSLKPAATICFHIHMHSAARLQKLLSTCRYHAS